MGQLPFQFVNIKYRAVRTDTAMAAGSVLHAAEAGAEAAGHLILQRNLAGNASLTSQTGNGLHHGLGTAGVDAGAGESGG